MDLSCIILSGDLELYVLGMLPEEEAHKIQQLAALFPEVQAEIDLISLYLEGFASTADAIPSPSVKDSLMNKLSAMNTEQKESIVAPGILAPPSPIEPATNNQTIAAPVVTMQPGRGSSALIAAAVIGFIISIGIIIYLSSINRNNKTEIATLNSKLNTLNQSYQQQQQQLNTYAQSMNIMQNENFRKINMTNVPGKPQALVQVFWNRQTHEVFVADISLPAHPANKQYQLWAIVNGKPVDAGMLNDTKHAMQKMKTFSQADAFAITLENAGGSPTPTMEAMYVLGKVS